MFFQEQKSDEYISQYCNYFRHKREKIQVKKNEDNVFDVTQTLNKKQVNRNRLVEDIQRLNQYERHSFLMIQKDQKENQDNEDDEENQETEQLKNSKLQQDIELQKQLEIEKNKINQSLQAQEQLTTEQDESNSDNDTQEDEYMLSKLEFTPIEITKDYFYYPPQITYEQVKQIIDNIEIENQKELALKEGNLNQTSGVEIKDYKKIYLQRSLMICKQLWDRSSDQEDKDQKLIKYIEYQNNKKLKKLQQEGKLDLEDQDKINSSYQNTNTNKNQNQKEGQNNQKKTQALKNSLYNEIEKELRDYEKNQQKQQNEMRSIILKQYNKKLFADKNYQQMIKDMRNKKIHNEKLLLLQQQFPRHLGNNNN